MSVYVVTGATGYIGSMLIKELLRSKEGAGITALVRDRKKGEEVFGAKVKIIEADLADQAAMESLRIPCDYFFHCASVTKSAEMVSHPVEVIQSIVNATQNVLELVKRSGVKSMVYLSSMEVYGRIDCSDGHKAAETELGEVDLLSARSCYPMGKRMAENICYSYFKEYGIPVKIARLAQTFGHGILQSDTRVFAQFARAVKSETDIILSTQGTSMGNYCAIDDVIEGIFTILHKGENGEAYNVVCEENTMEIRDMARLVAEVVAEGKIGVKIRPQDLARTGYAPDTGLRLSGEKLRKLGWKPKKGLKEMYEDLLEEWK